MTIQRKTQNKIQGGRKPRFAIAIDQRSGFKGLQKDMVFEPGTGYYVLKSESDGNCNLVTDPLNFPSEKMRYAEAISLKHSSPEDPLYITVELSAHELYIPSHVSAITEQFIDYKVSTNGG